MSTLLSRGVLVWRESITFITLSAMARPLKPAKPNEAAESRTYGRVVGNRRRTTRCA
jgi:hypothetical protein